GGFEFGFERGGGRSFAGLGRDRHADDVIAFIEIHAAHAISGTAHRTNILFVEADSLAFVRGEEDDLVAVRNGSGHQLVVFVDADGDNAARHYVGKILERCFLNSTVTGGEEDVLAFLFQIAHLEHGTHGFAGLQRDQVADVLALSGSADVRNFIHFQPVHTPRVGEDKNVGVGGCDEQVLDKILFAGSHAHAAAAATSLLAVGGNGRALHIAGVAHRDRHLLVGDEVFQLDFCGFVLNHGAALVAVVLPDFFQLL